MSFYSLFQSQSIHIYASTFFFPQLMSVPLNNLPSLFAHLSNERFIIHSIYWYKHLFFSLSFSIFPMRLIIRSCFVHGCLLLKFICFLIQYFCYPLKHLSLLRYSSLIYPSLFLPRSIQIFLCLLFLYLRSDSRLPLLELSSHVCFSCISIIRWFVSSSIFFNLFLYSIIHRSLYFFLSICIH